MMAAGGGVAALGLGGVGLEVPWGAQMACMVVLGFGFFLLHNSVQTEVTELAPSARASAFSLHAFSFFMGQALGPMVYGLRLPIFGWPCIAGVLRETGAVFGQQFPTRLCVLENRVVPVMLPPGRLRLETSPKRTGSPPIVNTIGIARVAACAARAEGTSPV